MVVSFAERVCTFSMQRLLGHPTVRTILEPLLARRRALLRRRARGEEDRFDRFTRLFAEDPVLRLDDFRGAFALSPGSHLLSRIALDGSYEPEMAAICRSHLDLSRDAIDVGANVGFFTVMMAHELPGRRVLAVEPTPGALARLHANLARNRVADRVVVVEGAAAAVSGHFDLSVIDGREEYASLGPLVHTAIAGSAHHTIRVPTTPLDDLVEAQGLTPGFLKIDVEGAEASVLQGATRTLAQHRPVVMAELNDPLLRQQGSSARAVLGLLADAGYALSDPSHPGQQPGIRPYGDVLAIPRESVDRSPRMRS